MYQGILTRLEQKRTAAGVLIAVVVFLTLHEFLLGSKTINGIDYTYYNNFVIFKKAFFHLLEGANIYGLFPNEHLDQFKYSPSFALLMAPFALLPDLPGLLAWNLLNALVLFFAIWKMPFKNPRAHLVALGIVLVELITSLQNVQSNGLIAGLILLGFNSLEKGKNGWAACFIVLTVFIKLFGLVAFALFLLYPGKLKSAVFLALWLILLAILPLTAVSSDVLFQQYVNWKVLLLEDHNVSYGLSVMGWLKAWFGWNTSKLLVVIAGIILFCLPLTQIKKYQYQLFRSLILASVLIWVVIFNHKAESPTYIIAVSGAAIWFASQKFSKINLFLILFALLFTSFSPTDLFPGIVRENFVTPYLMKAVPCIFIWTKLSYDLFSKSFSVDKEKNLDK